MTIAIESV